MVTHPAIVALYRLEVGRRVVARWADGQEMVFMPHNHFPPDENPDGVESSVGGVVEVTVPGVRPLTPRGLYEIRADDPPVMVMSPDRKRIWTAEPA